MEPANWIEDIEEVSAGELECLHGVGHSAGIHGCDGCCIPLVRQARADAWDEGFTYGSNSPVTGQTTDNPYRQGETE